MASGQKLMKILVFFCSFINRPLPMQAVVQLNAPPNTPVFTLQARDPDTDHSIHYFIVRDRSEFLAELKLTFTLIY